jgi:hypothetical protein
MMPDSNTAALNQKIMEDRDETQDEREARQAQIDTWAEGKLLDPAFLCEAFSEISEQELRLIGLAAAGASSKVAGKMMIGDIVVRNVRQYAMECAEKDLA